ncbi:hypothetical protein [Actinoplanes sp. HUAS TT8]|uniref:hypothetical protein n=1 Tax=Actinoplanes sp. HUAS TT8 TaxID=3447453 RepID=UPI003F51C71D
MRTIRALVTVALAVGVVFVDPVAARADDPHVMPVDPATYDDLTAIGPAFGIAADPDDPTSTAGCGAAASDPVPDGVPIVVRIGTAAPFTVGQVSAATWKNPPVADPSWRLDFQGLMWMKSLARRAAQDDQQQSLAALVAQAVQFHRADPDPGTNASGWDEGTALRRLESENCLYALTHADELAPGMAADAAVLLGKRYYGPPNYPVHNHGLMANLQLVRAGDLLGRADWKATAVRRMTAEAPLAFSKMGLSYEQASGYQGVNANLWGQAATVLAASPGTAAAAATLQKAVDAAWNAFAWETEPDGKIVQIGDSEESPGRAGNSTARTLRDDQTGTVIGRWSWTDRVTSYYTVRYGPPRRAHGQEDRAGGVTWSTLGTRVLVGPGKYNYDRTSAWNTWQIGPASHNVAIPTGGAVKSGKTARLSAATVQASAHAWTIVDDIYNTPHSRNVNVNRDAHRMVVTDLFSRVSSWQQHWHLDPSWTLESGKAGGTKLTFRNPAGYLLTVTTTGRVSGVVRGKTSPIGGWHFPAFGVRVPAADVVIRSYGKGKTTTTFVVTRGIGFHTF